MKFINLSLEDGEEAPNPESVDLQPSETEQAVDAVNSQNSEEPEAVIKVANYKEELAKLQAQKDENAIDEGAELPDPTGGDGGAEGEGGVPTDDGAEDSVTDDAAPSEEPDDKSGDDAGDDKEPTITEEEIKKGQAEVGDAMESIEVMSKQLTFLNKRLGLGGIDKHTAKIISSSLEHYSARLNYNLRDKLPAMESYEAYGDSLQSTRKLKVAIESFLDTIWEAICKFFKAVWKWISDIISPKKEGGGGGGSGATSTVRKAEMVNLRNALDKAEKKIKDTELLRAKDQLRAKENADAKNAFKLNRRIATGMFRNGDKGTLAEMVMNARNLLDLTKAVANLSRESVAISTKVSTESSKGTTPEIKTFMVEQNVLGSLSQITFSDEKASSMMMTKTMITNEIMAGMGCRFTLGNSAAISNLANIGINKALSQLGGQGFRMVRVETGNKYPDFLPNFTPADMTQLNMILKELEAIHREIDDIQATLKTFADLAALYSKDHKPPSWDNLDTARVTVLKSQLTFIGNFSLNMTGGYNTLTDQLTAYHRSFLSLMNSFNM